MLLYHRVSNKLITVSKQKPKRRYLIDAFVLIFLHPRRILYIIYESGYVRISEMQ